MSSPAEVAGAVASGDIPSSAAPPNPTPPNINSSPAQKPAALQGLSTKAQKEDTSEAVPNPKPEPKPKVVKQSIPAAEATGEKQLTAKELKEKKKAEKAARRAQSKAEAPPSQQKAGKGDKQQQAQGKGHKKNASRAGSGIVETVYVDQAGKQVKEIVKEVVEVAQPAKDMGLVGLLRDLELEQHDKKKKPIYGIDNAHVDVHPAILTLGMQINKRAISGSSARCLGFLLAIKRLIEDYNTPHDSLLNRHLPGQYLSHQINYITSSRPMAVAMGNSIRWLKTEISQVSPDSTDEEAKKYLCNKIDSFIHEKFTAAHNEISELTCKQYIRNGDVIITFSKSQIVEKILLKAHQTFERKFRVIVVDSRPLYEGQNLLTSLCQAGIECTYAHLHSLNYVMMDATKVFLGTHAIMANGALYSRSGTAATAKTGQENHVPVMVFCETIKFSEKINIDGIVSNEFGDTDMLVNTAMNPAFPVLGYLNGWKDDTNTTVSDFVYDITPSECVSIVVCEHGPVTPEGVGSIMRIRGGVER